MNKLRKAVGKAGIQLNTKQALLESFTEHLDLDALRDEMADDIINGIDQIVHDIPEAKERFENTIRSYLKKEWEIGDGWSTAKQYINIAIINTHQYGESALAIPKNAKVLSFLLPKLSENFGVRFKQIEEYQIQGESYREEVRPSLWKKNWNFYELNRLEE